jgi:predicted nucleic acid-binding protein
VTLTYVDAGVLIVAARGGEARSERALALILDSERTFAASTFLKLEVIPQTAFHRQAIEVAFYERYFESVSVWANERTLPDAALREASMYGLQAMDALHVVAASEARAVELVTLERPGRSIYRARAVRVVHLG